MGTSVVLAKNGGAIRRSPCFRSDSTVLVGGCFHERLGIRRGSRRKAIQAIRIVDSRGDAGPGVATPTTTDDNNEEQEEKGERRGVAAVCGADVLRVPVRVHLHARKPGPVKPVFRSVPGSWFPVPVPPHAKLSRQSSSERHTLLRRVDTILSDDAIQRLRFDDFD
ncbi:hypothetical protein V1478_008285 [Vespula squamosa]|uniref:Uncharacterized protein n=1 Tax=Vespula squamosa TaxID=30214 RepID=A0ABD2AYD8_VESSQ